MEKASPHETVIKPRAGFDLAVLGEAYRFRGLLYSFVWRDIKVRYKQSVLGVSWVLFRPLLTMLIFTAIFGRLARFPSEGVPYPVFVLMGLIPWALFSGALTSSSNGLLSSSNLITKVYFPRILAPVGASLSHALDASISFVMLLVLMTVYGVSPGAGLIWTPLLFLLVISAALGPGLFFSALIVRYRDIGQVVPFLVQVWMYVTPVIYPVDFIPEKYRWLIYLNPMCGVVEGFRACLLPGKPLDLSPVLASVLISACTFAAGFYYFSRVERSFADVI